MDQETNELCFSTGESLHQQKFDTVQMETWELLWFQSLISL